MLLIVSNKDSKKVILYYLLWTSIVPLCLIRGRHFDEEILLRLFILFFFAHFMDKVIFTVVSSRRLLFSFSLFFSFLFFKRILYFVLFVCLYLWLNNNNIIMYYFFLCCKLPTSMFSMTCYFMYCLKPVTLFFAF